MADGKVLTIHDLFAPSFWKVWNAIYYRTKTTICLAGGRGSCKSAFCALAIYLILEMDRRKALEHKRRGDKNWKSYLSHAIVYRKVANTLADSVYTEMQRAAEKLGLTDKYVFKKTPLQIERRGTGQRILFRGLDDPQRSKSLKAPYGWYKLLHFEEAAEFDGIEEMLDVQRSVQRGGHEFFTFMSYNPPETSANWVNYTMQQMADKDPLFGFYKSDYRTVPRAWLGDEFFRQAEILRRRNERQYRHVYLGEVTGNGGTVFPNVVQRHISDAEIKSYANIMWGCDFGLRDPTVLLGINYDSLNHKITIFDEIYKPDMTLDDMEREFKKHHFGYEYIVADCAGATLITTLRSRGIDMIPCKKGNDSILNGIKGLQSLCAIEIDSTRCPNSWREFTTYEYEKNKAGEFTGRLPDRDNHAIDACVVGNTRVQTPYGSKCIDQLEGTEGLLLGYDESTGVVKSVKYRHCRKTRLGSDVFCVRLEGREGVCCTADHRILTSRGYVEAGKLKRGDDVVCWDGNVKVKEVCSLAKGEDVYDLEVPETHNFIVNDGMVIHNCRYACEKMFSSTSWF